MCVSKIPVFDQKQRVIGSVIAENGVIHINIEKLPSAPSEEALKSFMIESIGKSIRSCWDQYPDSFEKC